jgi:hypothetical protein
MMPWTKRRRLREWRAMYVAILLALRDETPSEARRHKRRLARLLTLGRDSA